MELRHLRYFVVVAEEQNLHRAAERLHIARPALSRRIQDLEKELGIQLFERKQKRIRLSAAGRIYLEDAKQILAHVELAAARSRRVADGELGALVVGYRDNTLQHPVVAAAFSRFASRFPEVALKLVNPPGSFVDALLANTLDAALFYSSRSATDATFDYVEIARDALVLALPASHALAARRNLKLADLKSESFLWLEETVAPFVSDRLLAACQKGGLTPRITQTDVNEATRLGMVAMGLGVTFVPESVSALPENVVTRPVQDLSLTVGVALAWLRARRTPVLEHLIEIVNRARPAKRDKPRSPSRKRPTMPARK